MRELEKGGSSKPAHVVAKVRTDYTARLERVVQQLNANRDGLAKHAAALTAQIEQLAAAQQRLVDELAEQDLRKQVGELSESDWSSAASKLQADIAKVKAQQEVMASDVKRIRDIVASASQAPSVPSAPAAAAPGAPTDELAFLSSVVGTPTPAAPRSSKTKPIGPPPRPSAPAASRASRTSGGAGSLIEKPPPAVTINPSAADEPPLASNVPDGDIPLKASTAPSPTKKARCPKCAGLNIPSDWYCVHCGAELAI